MRDALADLALTDIVSRVLGQSAQISAVHEDADSVPQGASGGRVRAYWVQAKASDGTLKQLKVVTKEASPRERHVLQLLSAQGQAIPVTWVADPDADGQAMMYQEYAEDYPWDAASPTLTAQTADALAAIHAANLGESPAWLPRADRSFADQLFLHATQEVWDQNLEDPAFAQEFDRYTEPLHESLDHLLAVLDELTREDQTVTLINTDINPSHIRLARGRPCVIDWDQAHYGSLYLDLPNVFAVDTVLLYRDALARHGLAISPADFLERFRDVGRYTGLRYLEVGLLSWRTRGEDWAQQRWFLYFCLSIALRGR